MFLRDAQNSLQASFMPNSAQTSGNYVVLRKKRTGCEDYINEGYKNNINYN